MKFEIIYLNASDMLFALILKVEFDGNIPWKNKLKQKGSYCWKG